MIQHELQRDGDRIAIIRALLRKQFGYNYHALPDTCTQTDQYHKVCHYHNATTIYCKFKIFLIGLLTKDSL